MFLHCYLHWARSSIDRLVGWASGLGDGEFMVTETASRFTSDKNVGRIACRLLVLFHVAWKRTKRCCVYYGFRSFLFVFVHPVLPLQDCFFDSMSSPAFSTLPQKARNYAMAGIFWHVCALRVFVGLSSSTRRVWTSAKLDHTEVRLPLALKALSMSIGGKVKTSISIFCWDLLTELRKSFRCLEQAV